MADNLLDTTQNDLGATISQDPNLPSPQEQEARLARIREQEQALAERRRKSEETVNTLVNNIRGRINEEQRGGNALYEQFFAESARQQEANRARVTRNDSQPVFNPVTRTFSAGQTPNRSDEQAAVTAELKTQMGISSLGALLPENLTAAQTELPFLTESMRRDIAKTPGGAYAVREYDNRLSSVIDTLNSAIPDVLDEQGMVKGDELLAKARSSERYTPALAGAVKKYAEQMTKAYNTSELESQKLKQTVTNMKLDESIKRANLDAAEQDALQGGGYGAALKAINDGKESVYAPELSALSKAGMQVADQVIYLAGKLETTDSRSARYKAITNVTAKDVIGPDVNLNAEAVAEFEVNNTILEQARQNAADYYQQAVRRGENPVQYMTRQMADDIPEGTDDAEALYYIRQMTEMADQYVNNDVNTRAQAIIDQQTAGAKNAIVLMGSRLTSQGAQGSAEAYDMDTLRQWKSSKNSESMQNDALNGMFVDKLQARLAEIIGGAADPSSLGAIMDTYTTYINTLGTGTEGELASSDPAFRELIELRDAYVEQGKMLADTDAFNRRVITEDANNRGFLVAFDDEGKPREFRQDAYGKSEYIRYVNADAGQRQQIYANYKAISEARAKLEPLEQEDMGRIKRGLVEVEPYASTGGRLGFGSSIKSAGARDIYPTREEEWDNYLLTIESRYAVDPERQARIMEAALESKAKWQEDTAKSLGIDVEQLRDIGQANVAGGDAYGGLPSRGSMSRESYNTLKDIATNQMQVNQVGEIQPLVPDKRFKEVADGILIQGYGKIDKEEGKTLTFFVNDAGTVTFRSVPDEQIAKTTPEELAQSGVYIFGQNLDRSGATQ